MTARYTLIVGDCPWRLIRVEGGRAQREALDCAEDVGVTQRAEIVAAKLHGSAGGGRIVLALPSDWCLSAGVDVSDLPRTNRRQAMQYLLEEHLPLSAEDAVMDFSQRHGRALGVCAELDRLRPIVDALRDAGVQAVHLCPLALLAGAYLTEKHPDAAELCLSTPDGVDLIDLDQQSPMGWRWFGDPAVLADEDSQRESEPAHTARGTCVLFGEAIELARADCVHEEVNADSQCQIDDIAALQAARYLDGEASPWIDLGQNALATSGRYGAVRTNMAGLVAALALFLLCTGLMTYWRGERYARQVEQLQAQQVSIYKELMPGQRVPPSIQGRLESERRRLAGLGGEAGTHDTGHSTLHPSSALTHLHRMLSAWPVGERCRLSDITIEPGLIRLNGEAARSVTPERFAASLRETGVYEVAPPNISALNQFGFSFGFIARPIPPDETDPLATERRR